MFLAPPRAAVKGLSLALLLSSMLGLRGGSSQDHAKRPRRPLDPRIPIRIKPKPPPKSTTELLSRITGIGKSSISRMSPASRFAWRKVHVFSDRFVLETRLASHVVIIPRGPDMKNVTVVQEPVGLGGEPPPWAPHVPASKKRREGPQQSLSIDGVFGVFLLPSGPVLAVITDSEEKYRGHGMEFRVVSKVDLLRVSNSSVASELEEEDNRQVELLKMAFKAHDLYFSTMCDVTHSTQRRAEAIVAKQARGRSSSKALPSALPAPPMTPAGMPSWRRADERFFWNKNILKPLIDAGADDWVLPVMSAHVQAERNCTLVAEDGSSRGPFTLLLVSRRSCYRQGRRFLRRGIDIEGNVANFVETEQMLIQRDGSITSFVQVRGSIPLFWSSPANLKYTPKVTIERSLLENAVAAERHSRELVDIYGDPLEASASRYINTDAEHPQRPDHEPLHATSSTRRDVKSVPAAAVAISTGSNAGRARATASGGSGSARGDAVSDGREGGNSTSMGGGSGGRFRDRGRGVQGRGLMGRLKRAVGHDDDRQEHAGPPAVIYVNLIDKKKDQGRLGRAMELVLWPVSCGLPLRYEWFDFHHECRKMNWHALSGLLESLDKDLRGQGFFHRDAVGRVKSWQRGVLRTNCMDCLDRTNVVQSIFARWSLAQQLQTLGHRTVGTGTNGTVLQLPVECERIERALRHLWSSNADAISVLYAGTPALKGDFTRTGKRTRRGVMQDGLNSAMRYVINNFVDEVNQMAVDAMLGTDDPFTVLFDHAMLTPPESKLWVQTFQSGVASRQRSSAAGTPAHLVIRPSDWARPLAEFVRGVKESKGGDGATGKEVGKLGEYVEEMSSDKPVVPELEHVVRDMAASSSAGG